MSNRHTIIRLSFGAIIAIVGLSISMLTYAAGEDNALHGASSGTATITIEQKNAFDGKTIGSWTLLRPGDEEVKGSQGTFTLKDAPAGTYTLIAKAPDGTTTSVRTYKNEEALDYIQRPQITFKLEEGESFRIVIHYSLTKTGVVSVQSDPPGIDFKLSGPNGMHINGTTPASYQDSPEGQYKVQFVPLKGCFTPAPQNQQLQAEGRASFDLIVDCEAADKIRSKAQSKDDDFVVITIDGKDVTLRDVPQNTWFSENIFNAAKYGVLSGYKNDNGQPNGMFGPGNNVTVAELAKIAHKIGGVSEEAFIHTAPDNPLAGSAWFSPFIASAENRGWTIYKDANIDPLRPATRGEVIVTFLQALDVPLRWQKGQMFKDVTLRTRFAHAIETAAGDGIVDGRKDSAGNPLHLFGPEDPINRAEIAKIINDIFAIYKTKK